MAGRRRLLKTLIHFCVGPSSAAFRDVFVVACLANKIFGVKSFRAVRYVWISVAWAIGRWRRAKSVIACPCSGVTIGGVGRA